LRSTSGDWLDAFDRAKDAWIEFYWVAVPYDEKAHGESLKRANDALNQRKNIRHFPAIDERGWKCTVTGASSALPIPPADAASGYGEMRAAWAQFAARYDNVTIRSNEMLGALALIKRFAQKARALELGIDLVNFPSTRHIGGKPEEEAADGREVDAYYAILHMDGDQMGDKLSMLERLEDHRAISQALATFAQTRVPDIVADYDRGILNPQSRAVLIYAGGDDVLALLPLRFVLACADEIRKAYSDMMEHDGGIPNATMSAGIAIVPTNYPLDAALEIARSAEKHAKNDYGRNAVVVIEAHGTGQQREAGAQWDTEDIAVIRVMADLQAAFTPPAWLSAKLGYDLQDLAYRLVGHNVPAEARAAELKRVIKQRSMSFHDNKDDARVPIDEFAEALAALSESPYCGWQSLANWVILTRFLATGGRDS